MGQIIPPPSSSGFPKIVAVDRLKASNAGAGQSGNHVFMVGANAGDNSTGSYQYIIGENAGNAATGSRIILLGANAGVSETVDDIIVIGDGSLNQPVTDSALAGTIVIGNASAKDLVGSALAPVTAANTIIGFQTAPTQTYGYANVFLGDRVLDSMVGTSSNNTVKNVIIGSRAAHNLVAVPMPDNVIIGYDAGSVTAAGLTSHSINGCVIIGSTACNNSGADGNLLSSVYIGAAVARNVGNAGFGNVERNIVIGASSAGALSTGNDNTIVGTAAFLTGNPSTIVAVGSQIGSSAGSPGNFNVFLGPSIDTRTGSNSVFIGYKCNAGPLGAQAYTNKLLIEETTSAADDKALIFGDFATGNIVLGNSIQGTNRDTVGTNTVKLIAGTVGAAPSGGGYFYVTGANNDLHWVNSAGTDTNLTAPSTATYTGIQPRIIFNESDQGADLKIWDFDVQVGVFTLRTRTDADGAGVNVIAVTRGATTAITDISFGNATNNPTFTFLGTGTPKHGSTTLLATSVALANGAGAGAGTITNAPAAGNPTKWIPIDDNGTTRYIPAW